MATYNVTSDRNFVNAEIKIKRRTNIDQCNLCSCQSSARNVHVCPLASRVSAHTRVVVYVCECSSTNTTRHEINFTCRNIKTNDRNALHRQASLVSELLQSTFDVGRTSDFPRITFTIKNSVCPFVDDELLSSVLRSFISFTRTVNRIC